MKTEKILELLKENQFKADSFEKMPWVSNEFWESIEEVHSEETNPRREYLGIKTVYKNKTDGKYFFVEEYGNDMGHEIYDFAEVKPVEKTIISYERVK